MYQTCGMKLMRLEVGMTVYPIVFHNDCWRAGQACQIIEILDNDSVYLSGQYSGLFALSDVALTEEKARWYASQRNKNGMAVAA